MWEVKEERSQGTILWNYNGSRGKAERVGHIQFQHVLLTRYPERYGIESYYKNAVYAQLVPWESDGSLDYYGCYIGAFYTINKDIQLLQFLFSHIISQ